MPLVPPASVIHRVLARSTIFFDGQLNEVLDRFLEAAGDVAQADGAALGLLGTDGTVEMTAASGSLELKVTVPR